MLFKSITSPNYGERKNGAKPSMIILHYTGMETAKAALDRLCDPKGEVSAHYFIDENGKVLHLVQDDKRAWHAGASFWGGETDINSHSLGIELVNKGHEFGYEEFPDAQLKTLIKLCKKLMKKYGIAPANVLAHSDVAPGRKQDPGEKFPWHRLAKEGVGLWPEPIETDFQAAEDLIINPLSLDELLCSFGYNPDVTPEERLESFCLHYYPEKILELPAVFEPDILAIARLLALIQAERESKT